MSRVTRVAAVTLTLAFAACSDTVTAPQTNQPATAATASASLARYAGGPPQVAAFAAQTIGPEGGTVSLAGFEMIVPAGAVSKPTTFTIRLPGGARNAEYVWASFGPTGVRFDRPLTLRLPFAGTSSEGNTPQVVWFDGSTWVPTSTTTTDDGRIQTQTTQITDYGTQETNPSKGIEPVGG